MQFQNDKLLYVNCLHINFIETHYFILSEVNDDPKSYYLTFKQLVFPITCLYKSHHSF